MTHVQWLLLLIFSQIVLIQSMVCRALPFCWVTISSDRHAALWVTKPDPLIEINALHRHAEKNINGIYWLLSGQLHIVTGCSYFWQDCKSERRRRGRSRRAAAGPNRSFLIKINLIRVHLPDSFLHLSTAVQQMSAQPDVKRSWPCQGRRKKKCPVITKSSAACLYVRPLHDYMSCCLITALFVQIEYNNRLCKNIWKKRTTRKHWNIIHISPRETINLLFHLTNVTSFWDSYAECVLDIWWMQ